MLYNIINNIRIISLKSIQIAKSGHPGMPMGIGDIFVIFWYYFYKKSFLLKNINDDKIIISNGHGVIIQYIMLYLNKLYFLIDIKKLRKFNSKTPAHPEISNFIDASTGPLGQGIGIGIGIGLKNKIYSFKFNKKINLFNNKIWIFCGDGCLMEGVSNESISFCGVYNINNIILIYDSNNISIDGDVKKYFFENLNNKFNSMNWNVIGPINGHVYLDIYKAILIAKKSKFPTFIYFKTIIGFLSPNKSYTNIVHGNTFNKTELINIYKNYFIKYIFKKKIFFINKIKYLHYYKKNYFFRYLELIRILNNKIQKINIINIFNNLYFLCINKSTRLISSYILNKLFKINEFLGGSADLTSSNLTFNKNLISIKRNFFNGRYINFGVREFLMSLIIYGLSINNYGLNFCSTFLVFSNYIISSIRSISISKLKNIFIFTHDSFFVGEDGPSHQPIEQISLLRKIPRFYIFRPFNFIEVIICWIIYIKLKKNSCCIILSRQNYKNEIIYYYNIKNIIKGGYKIINCKKKIELLIISSGSDLEIVFDCYLYLKKYFNIEIVSIYCNKLFDKQKKNYKKFLKNKILVIESSNDDIWNKYNFNKIFILNVKKYGKSGSNLELKKFFNFTKKIFLKICLFLIKL
ncbi:transketolase-like TK C-terminal-containing protein [Candidatus Carsonella ruddii]|uniref:Transketolase n=1 Tax=Candidatus Carsonella ruddii HC isolate Thao2000 TaxID=1202538 RepID=J3YPW5_CARRU|nr:transketolase [Candidatus Carsonella ruddii]AFP83868.1 transketolase [Candidatus Carsonella ruddii HC isolate Thao2000]